MFRKKQKTQPATATVMKLTPQTREFLALMHFPTIPPEAKFLAFWDDGEAQFFEEFEVHTDSIMPVIPSMSVISYYKNVPLTSTD